MKTTKPLDPAQPHMLTAEECGVQNEHKEAS